MRRRCVSETGRRQGQATWVSREGELQGGPSRGDGEEEEEKDGKKEQGEEGETRGPGGQTTRASLATGFDSQGGGKLWRFLAEGDTGSGDLLGHSVYCVHLRGF